MDGGKRALLREDSDVPGKKAKAAAKAPPMAPVCASCKQTPSSAREWARYDAKTKGVTVAAGGQCLHCAQVFAAGFSYMGWEEFCDLQQREDPHG